MRLLIATDAWRPQVNGVVRTYERLAVELVALGVRPMILAPNAFPTVPCPSYPEIRLALPAPGRLAAAIERLHPDAIHIATEGPVGWMTRRYCRRRGLPFTTSFHTKFPEYLAQRFGMPASVSYAALRAFHNSGSGTLVASPSLAADLSRRGFRNLAAWSRGVDTDHFRPRPGRTFGDAPVLLCVGRVAVEKNLEAFLDLDVPGRKVVVGDGPQLGELKRRYPSVLFAGHREGEALAQAYASADVLVFPSRTDTFGMVLLEAMASGLPIAAYPVTGPIDVVRPGVSGVLSDDLGAAVAAALKLDRTAVRAAAHAFDWRATAAAFLAHVEHASLSRRPGSAATSRADRTGEHKVASPRAAPKLARSR